MYLNCNAPALLLTKLVQELSYKYEATYGTCEGKFDYTDRVVGTSESATAGNYVQIT